MEFALADEANFGSIYNKLYPESLKTYLDLEISYHMSSSHLIHPHNPTQPSPDKI